MALYCPGTSKFMKANSFASNLILRTSNCFKYFCAADYVLQINTNHFWHLAEHSTMQKQSSQALYSSRLLLTPKRCALPSRHLHTSIVEHLTPASQLRLWSSASQPSKRRCLEAITGLYQIRRESTIEKAIGVEKENQNRAPWHREGSDLPPVARQRSAGAMVKGSRVLLPAFYID